LTFGGKVLEDNKSLAAYGIENGSTISVEHKLNGGNMLKIEYLLIVVLVMGIMSFITIMGTGMLPVIANVFYYMIKYTIDTLISIFTYIWNLIKQEEVSMGQVTGQRGGQGRFDMKKSQNKYKQIYQAKMEQEGAAKAQSYNFIGWLYDAVLFVLKNGITIIFVYTCAAILMVPIFFYRTADKCKSLNLAHYVGLTTAIIYFIFYGLFFNTIDSVINTYLFASSVLPRFLKFIPDFLSKTVEDSWDESKFAGWYAIPFVGQALMAYHEAVQSVIIYLKEFLDQESQYGCDNPTKYNNVKTLFANLVYKNKRSGAHVEHLDREQLGDNFVTSMLREFIRMFKLDATVELMNMGFNENEKYEAQFAPEPFFQKFITSDYWDFQASGILKSIFCGLLAFGTMINGFIDAMNGPLGLGNMIKSGNISGLLASIAYIVMIILSFLLNGMFGIQIKTD